MSILTLLIVSGVVAALAFFLAGYLLHVPKIGDAALLKLSHQREALESEIDHLRTDYKAIQEKTEETDKKYTTAEAARHDEEERRASLERELLVLKTELERVTAKKQTLAERLRIAEDKNRAAFEQEEANIEAFHRQLEATKADYLRREQTREKELGGLRAEADKAKEEKAQVLDELQKLHVRAETAEQELEDLRFEKEHRHETEPEGRADEQFRQLALAHEQARQAAEQIEGLRKELAADRERAERLAKELDTEQLRAERLYKELETERQQAKQSGETHETERQEWLEQARQVAQDHETEKRRLSEAYAADQEELKKARQIADTRENELKLLEASLQEISAREQDAVKRLIENETAWQAKAAEFSSQKSIPPAEKQELALQLKKLQYECESERDQKKSLAITLRVSEEALERERAEAKAAAEAMQKAEARLKELDRLAQENAELREQLAESAREAKLQADREGEAKDAKVELAAAQAKLNELERTLDENRKLRDQVAELHQHQEASGELERLTAAHKQVRLDAELMARRLKEVMQENAELGGLRVQAAEAASLSDEVAYLRRREKDLEAVIYANGFHASRERPALSGELLMQAPVNDLETNLHTLVAAGGPRTAVLADAKGFLIASAGESGTQEGLAAFTAVAGEMVTRARMLLPLADVESVKVTDANSIILTCHLFDSAEEGLGLVTLGPGEPKPENTQQAIYGLAAIVSGTLATDAEEPKPEPDK
jgi:hypothetical protein